MSGLVGKMKSLSGCTECWVLVWHPLPDSDRLLGTPVFSEQGHSKQGLESGN